MPEKHQSTSRTSGNKAVSGHGNFKHTTQGTTLKTVLGAYGLKNSDYQRVRELVVRRLPKEPAHAR